MRVSFIFAVCCIATLRTLSSPMPDLQIADGIDVRFTAIYGADAKPRPVRDSRMFARIIKDVQDPSTHWTHGGTTRPATNMRIDFKKASATIASVAIGYCVLVLETKDGWYSKALGHEIYADLSQAATSPFPPE